MPSVYSDPPQLPSRPSLPPALWALAAAWAGQYVVATLSFDLSVRQVWLIGVAGLVLAALGALGTIVALRRGGMPALTMVAMLVLSLSLGLISSGWHYSLQRVAAQDLRSSAPSSWRYLVVSDAKEGAYGFRCRARAYREGFQPAEVWILSQDRLERGVAVSCVGRFRELGDDDYARSSWAQGVCGSITVIRLTDSAPTGGLTGVLMAVRRRILHVLSPQSGESRALMAGCLCGSREALDTFGLGDEFSSCGIAHLIAVSGAHLATVALLVTRVLETFGTRLSVRLVLLASITGLFVLFCGAPPSAVRAWVMSLVGFGSQLMGRRSHALSSVCVVALVFVLARPTISSSLGFQLSVLSVMGLCLYAGYANYALKMLMPELSLPRWLRGSRGKALRGMSDTVRTTVAASLVCQLATLPVTARVFGRLSPVSPLANVLVSPAISLLLVLGVIVGTLSCLPLAADLALWVCDVLAVLPLRLVHGLASLSWASVSVDIVPFPIGILSLFILALVLVVWPPVSRSAVRRTLVTLAVMLVVMIVKWRVFAPARIVVLDIGQGDAILVQDGSAALLVDTGPDEAVVAALAREHVLHLDAVVLTHLHDDHYGGLSSLVGSVACERVYVARGVRDAMDDELQQCCLDLTSCAPEELSYGDVVRVGSFSLRMIWPTTSVNGDENCESIEMVVSYDAGGKQLSALLTGDAERDETGACLRSGDVGDIDFLKVGHHGSEVSLTPEEVAALDPELAIASAGEGNDYGHPAPVCVQMLEAGGATVLCTKDVGDVEVRPGASGPVIRCSGGRADFRALAHDGL